MRDLTLHIEGMSCGHCLNAVRRALESVPGVELGTIQIGRAQVRYDAAKVTPGQLESAVAAAGYKATAA
jgi:copper chaperone CopZ